MPSALKMSSSADGSCKMVGDHARRGYSIESVLLGVQDQRSWERTIGRQSGAAIGDPADDIDQSAAGCGREFGDASPRIAKSDNASSICCGKCPAQPATRLLLRNKNVLRGRFDHRLQQSFTIAGTGAQ